MMTDWEDILVGFLARIKGKHHLLWPALRVVFHLGTAPNACLLPGTADCLQFVGYCTAETRTQ